MYTTQSVKETRRDYVLRELTRLIISCEIKPGAAVSEQELADRLGVSRTPVREAMVELAKSRILETFPQRGCKISLIDYSLIQEAIFVRTILESAILDEVCAKVTEEDLQLLEKNLLLQNYYLENRMAMDLLESDNEFHMILFEIADKRQTFQLISNLSIHFDRLRLLGLSTIKDIKIVEDHRAILDAVKAGDAHRARQILEGHTGKRSQLNEAEIRQAHPDYFAPKEG